MRSFPVLFVAYCLGFTVAASAQVIPGEEDFTDDIGRLGNVDERFAHDACDTCFTVPGLPDNSYHIFQSITVDGEEQIIPRSMPNPAPLRDDADPRGTIDPDSGKPVWYIGDQAHVGPTDREPFSQLYRVPLIDLKVIHRQNTDAIMGVLGVHGFGIGKTGFTVAVLPEYATLATAALPTTIDGVPVTVSIEPRPQLIRHDSVLFRPIPVAAGISVLHGGSGGIVQSETGTLGPHIVRTEQNIGSCCQIWALTATHVVKSMDEAMPVPGTRLVFQPVTVSHPFPFSHQMGTVRYAFELLSCNTAGDPECTSAGLPVNWTFRHPDVAAIDPYPTGNFNPSPHNHPTGTDLTRHLQRGDTSYINGPSGKIMEAEEGDPHWVWGSITTAGKTGIVEEVNRHVTVRGVANKLYKMCCLNSISGIQAVKGDSGALVAYEGTGNRHVAGVAVAAHHNETWYVPADDIKTAFSLADVGFNHYWGTKSDYRKPATKACDDPHGC